MSCCKGGQNTGCAGNTNNLSAFIVLVLFILLAIILGGLIF